MNKINVGVFPCEAENAYELYRSLQYATRFNVIGLASKVDHCKYEYRSIHDGLPYIFEDDFLSRFIEALAEENIEYIFPTHDSVAEYLKEIEDKLPAKVLCSPLETAQLCRDKEKLYHFLEKEDFCPQTYSLNNLVFPSFAKPKIGQGGNFCQLLQHKEDMKLLTRSLDDMIFCEYLSGIELTIDCFTDRKGQLLYAGARTRDVIKQGIAYSSASYPLSDEIIKILQKLNTMLTLRGLWFCQLKKDVKGAWKLLEVSTRIATTMNLTRHKGVNLPLLALYDALGYDLDVLDNSFLVRISRSLQTKYELSLTYQTVYLDLDDTLIVNNAVNIKMIAFVYQCINNGKTVVLLTKHDGDVYEYLERYKINASLFAKIIHIPEDKKKSAYYEDKNGILIDNLYVERKEALECGLAVFDVDAIDALLEYY